MKKNTFTVIAAVLLSLVFIGPSLADRRGPSGAVYVMTNAPDGNEIAVYSRDRGGLLEFEDYYPTNGAGSGDAIDPLGSQGSLVISPNHRWLFAVNAGSDSISVFRIRYDGLELVGAFDSGGQFPVSLTMFNNLLYVLNAGPNPNITGFRVSHRGELIALIGSTRDLAPGGYHQVGFDLQGDVLVVTEGSPDGPNLIHVFSVDRKGLPGEAPVTSPSNGIVPFGFIFDCRDQMLVSEAGSSAVTYYKILRDNSLRIITPSAANGQAATCWIAGAGCGLVYTANTGTGTISAYELVSGNKHFEQPFGKKRFKRRYTKSRLELLDAEAGGGFGPIDLTTVDNGRFLYVLNANDGTVGMFRIKSDGSLVDLGTVDGLPIPSAQGIAAY